MTGASPDSDRATHERSRVAPSPPTVGIPSAAAILLYELYDAEEREAFAVACDGGSRRKNALALDRLGLARWCGTNWGSHFFQITDEGKAFIDAEVSALGSRLATAAKARGEQP